MANRFQQYIEKPAPALAEPSTAAPAAGAPTTDLLTPAPAPRTNRYQQYLPPPGEPTVKENLGAQFAYGIASGIPNAATGMLDLGLMPFTATELGRGDDSPDLDVDRRFGEFMALEYGPRDPNLPNGWTEDQRRAGWQKFVTEGGGPAPKPHSPSVGQSIQAGLSSVGLNVNDYLPEPQTYGERLARMGGEGAVTAMLPLPGNKAQGAYRLWEFGKMLLAGTAGGVAAQAAMEAAPEEYKIPAGLAAGIVGGIGGYGVPSAIEGVARAGVEHMRPVISTEGNVKTMAAERLASAASDPAAAAAALENAPTYVPGSRPTSAQASRDTGLATLERALARGDPKFKERLIARIEENNEAQIGFLDSIAEGDPAGAAQFFRDRMAALEAEGERLYAMSEKAANGEYKGLGEMPAGEVGDWARSAISDEFKRRNTEINILWRAIDPDGTMNVATEPLVEASAKVYGAMSPEEMMSLSGPEKAIADIIGSYSGPIPFSRFKDLRSEITRAMREAKSFASPNDRAYGRLSRLRDAVEASVQQSVTGRFAENAELADTFVRRAKEWYETGTGGRPVTDADLDAAAEARGAANKAFARFTEETRGATFTPEMRARLKELDEARLKANADEAALKERWYGEQDAAKTAAAGEAGPSPAAGAGARAEAVAPGPAPAPREVGPPGRQPAAVAGDQGLPEDATGAARPLTAGDESVIRVIEGTIERLRTRDPAKYAADIARLEERIAAIRRGDPGRGMFQGARTPFSRLDEIGAELNRQGREDVSQATRPAAVQPVRGTSAATEALSMSRVPYARPADLADQPRRAPADEQVIQQLDPREIGVDARRFQFKEGGDEQGITDRLQGIERWDPRLAGTVLVFRDQGGKDWIADGHQRMGLAKRLMDEGHPPIKMNAFVLDARNGVSEGEARAIAAVKNIAEGTGTPVDAAKVMKAAKETGVDLPPLPPRSTLVRDGRALAELSPEAFGMVINDVVPPAYGAIVGRLVRDGAQQQEAVRLLAAMKPDNARQAEMVVRDMLASGTEAGTRQAGLFGEEAFASSVTLERAKIADEALKQLKRDKALFSTLVSEAERIEGAGNRLARETNVERLSTDEKAADLLNKLAFRAGPVSDELTRLGRALKAGDTSANAAARDFLGAVRGAIARGLDEGADAGGAGARATDEGVTPRDPHTLEMFQGAGPKITPAIRAAQERFAKSRQREDRAIEGPKPSFEEMKAALRERSAAMDAMAEALDGLPGGIALRSESDLGAMVTRDSITGKWRVTYFDQRGFSGHSEYPSRIEAIRGALQSGYVDYAPNAIREAMGEKSFTLYQRANKGDAPNVIRLADVRERRALEGFRRGLMSKIGERVAENRAATKAAINAGVFKELDINDRLRSQNDKGEPLAPMKVTGRFLREWRDSKFQRAPFERAGVKPTIVEFNGKQYVPMLRVQQGDPAAGGDYFIGDVAADLMRDRKMTGPRELFQAAPGEYGPTFYSAALRAVETNKTGKASPQQWLATIKNTPGVKQEELDWIGLEDWLNRFEPDMKVSRDRVESFIKANQIEVEETDLGAVEPSEIHATELEPIDPGDEFIEQNARDLYMDDARERLAFERDEPDADQIPEQDVLERAIELARQGYDEEPEYQATITVTSGEGERTFEVMQQADFSTDIYDVERQESVYNGNHIYMDAVRDKVREYLEERGEWISDEQGPQYESYTLPGGEDYHELLLRLPRRTDAATTRPSAEVQARYREQWVDLTRQIDELYDKPDNYLAIKALRDKQDALHAKSVEETLAEAAPWRKGRNYEAPHFGDDAENILAHVRFKTRRSAGEPTPEQAAALRDWERDESYRRQNIDALGDDIRRLSKEIDESMRPEYAELMRRFQAGELDMQQWGDAKDALMDRYRSPDVGGEPAQRLHAMRQRLRELMDAAPPKPEMPEPKKTLFLEEVQSDWHQQGRERGYQQRTPATEADIELKFIEPTAGPLPGGYRYPRGHWEARDRRDGSLITRTAGDQEWAEAMATAVADAKHKAREGVPDAPFKTTWPELALKRMVRWAAQNGFDQVAWTPGKVQNARYSLATQVDNIEWQPAGFTREDRQVAIHPKDGLYIRLVVDKDGKVLEAPARLNATGKGLDEVLGKGLADRIMAEPRGMAEGEGLELGGGGMTGFYDKMLVSIGNKLGKKFGSKVGMTKVQAGGRGDYREGNRQANFVEAHVLPITDDMRASVMRGQPLFQKGKEALAEEPGAEGKPQLLMEGIEPVSDKAKIELAAKKPLRGGNAPMQEGGLFDEDVGKQGKLFQRREGDEAAAGTERGPGVRPVSGEAAPSAKYARREADGSLKGLPKYVRGDPARNVPSFKPSVYPDGQKVAERYMAKAGLDYRPPNTYVKVVPERATRIAAAYDAMPHDPQNPAVKRAYAAMIDETLAQYQAMLDDGVKIEFIGRDQPDPYAGNPRNMTEDVRNNKHMWVFNTKQGFGSDATFDPIDNPLLAETPFKISGQTATANDIFRAVHDYFGHVKEGVGFRADGEENAWRSHSAMYSPEARKAMTSETRGQNSWVNYGPFGEKNRTARSEETHYADQKIGILPDWVIEEGAGDDLIADTIAKQIEAAGRPPEEARATGIVVDATYTSFADRLGKSVDELIKQFPLPVFRKGDGKNAGSLQQVPIDEARRLNTKLNLPKEPVFAEAVANTPGAEIVDDGLVLDLTRYQPDDQSGRPSIRTGMFYLPSRAPQLKHYRSSKNTYGGSEKIQGQTLVRNPLFVKGATGGNAVKAAYDTLKGKGAYEAMRTDVLRATSGYGKRATEADIAVVLEKYGAGTERAWDILDVAGRQGGNHLPYAIQENIAAHAIRAAGHDAMVGWSQGRGGNGAFISEVFDVREDMAPTPEGDFMVRDEFYQPLFQGKDGPRGSITFGDPNVIKMFEAADASTGIHEGAHHFLPMFKTIAEAADAPEAVANDWRATKAWWDRNANDVARDAGEGITAADVRKVLHQGTTGNRMKDLQVDAGLQEQWARAFETYMREGKAPNSALKAIFEQFKQWLTSIYRRAEELNVNLSPEMRGVFDRMLGAEEPAAPSPRMMDAAAAQRFGKATAATRELKDVFGAKPVKQMLRRPGPTYPFEMSSESVAANLFKPGPEGAANIKNVIRAGAPKDAIEAAAVLSLKRAATKDGTIEPAKFEAWRSKHADALREVPELQRRMTSASEATKAMVDVGERVTEARRIVERSAAGKLLKVSDDADVAATLGAMLGKQESVRSMRELATDARTSPDAMAGLQRALVDYMIGRLKTPKDALRADTFQRFLGKNAPALSEVLTPEQMQNLHALALDVKRASRDVRAPGGGPDTAENLANFKRFGIEAPSILTQVVRRFLTSGAVGLVTHAFHGPVWGAVSFAGSVLGGTVIQALRQAGITKVEELIREAMLNPELMRALLMKAPKHKSAASVVRLRHVLAKLAARQMALGIQGNERWENRRQVKPKRDESQLTPMLGVRG